MLKTFYFVTVLVYQTSGGTTAAAVSANWRCLIDILG